MFTDHSSVIMGRDQDISAIPDQTHIVPTSTKQKRFASRLLLLHSRNSWTQTTITYRFPPVLTILSENLVHLFLPNASKKVLS